MKKSNTLSFTDNLHRSGRIFTAVCLVLMCLVPVIYCLSAGVTPMWGSIGMAFSFILTYVAIGLIEAVSYAPILGVGGQYLSFLTGNISNLRLPCAINAQNIAKTKQGSEEQEIISTIAIAVSGIVTTIIIGIGIIPLAIWGADIVEVLKPVSPYVIPAIFGGLGLVLIARYLKLTAIPFAIMLVIALITFLLGKDLGQATMLSLGMGVSLISGFITYKIDRKKTEKAAK
ncbi:MAG: hypothetical protein WC292_06805 [Clostridia bacterium]